MQLIDKGAFAVFVEERALLKRTDGTVPSKEYLAGFTLGALAYRLYVREGEIKNDRD